MEECIEKVLDTRGALRCVRFASGNVGVVNTQGETKLVVGPFQQLNFAGNGFLRVYNRVENEEGKAKYSPYFPCQASAGTALTSYSFLVLVHK